MSVSLLRSIFMILIFLTASSMCQNNPRKTGNTHHGPTSTGIPPSSVDQSETVGPQDAASVKACKDRILQTNPSVGERYSETMLDEFCGRNVVWERTVGNLNNSNQSLRKANFTDAQLAWLHTLHRCEDAECVCQFGNGCTTPTDSSGNGNGTSRTRKRNKRQRFPVDNFLPNRAGRALRQEIRQMSDNERWRFFRAMNNLKNDHIDGMSKYDIMVMYHTPDFAPEAHFSSALLPFHREMLKNVELALRMYDPGVALPYWDSTVDAPLPNPADSILWTGDFVGNGFGTVQSGPYAGWWTMGAGRLSRNLGRQGRLMDERDVGTIMRKPRYRNLVYCVDPFLELTHGGNHMWVGGQMGPLRTSPNDPLFYSLHAFVDLIWENWRWGHQGFQQRENEYFGCTGVSQYGAQMMPFPLINGDGLSNRYTNVFYTYTDRPFCPDCSGSGYYFCDSRWNKCVSKIRLGGVCSGYEGMNACISGHCANGRCVGGNGGNNNNGGGNNANNAGHANHQHHS